MRRVCSGFIAALALAGAMACSSPGADAPATATTTQAPTGPAEPYKLGMFSQGTRVFPGLVLDDSLVVDLSQAGINAPATVQELIASWDQATSDRVARVAADARRQAPTYSFKVDQLKTLPPITNPGAVLMAARNFAEHAAEMAATGRTLGTTTVVDEKVKMGMPGYWTRKPDDTRGNPYLFPKLKQSLSADNVDIVLPPSARTMIDFECELALVIGKTAKNVPVERALDHVFGYMAMVDVSDREDRADGRYGSDWLMGKSHDTFGPIGPYVVPAAFVGDPQNLAIKYTLNDQVMQDDTTAQMIHTMAELVSYASTLITLNPGDIIDGGTPGGVGEARTPPVYLKPGDRGVCTIEKIGSLRNNVVAGSSAPTPTSTQ
jgi:2-keto-4-pentenoate hydratase/2-oxohepta-3-ene-1,7-dioic acid hydratase in catechol pathway